MKRLFNITVIVIVVVLLLSVNVLANCPSCDKLSCSSFVAGKLATTDGYTMSGHTCDGDCDFTLKVIPAADHDPDEKYVIDWEGLPGGFVHTVKAEIPQVPHTNKYFLIETPIGNEYQVFFGENTTSTKEELWEFSEDEGIIDWTELPALALQRGKTARECILVIGKLIEKYGMNGSGESLLISDPNEAWVLEVPGFSYQWVAQRIPDDQVCPHANRMRIGEVDLEDTEHFLASPNLIKLPQEKGLYDPEKDGPFNFWKVYDGSTSVGDSRREWRMLSLLCPSKNWDPDAETYPFSVKPEFKISPQWWIENVWRDHMEGTPYDMTKGIAAGPFGNPERPSISGVSSERAISIPRTSYSWVSQSRSGLPDPVGGVIWFAMDAPHSSCYVPFYMGISQTPKSWRSGDFTKFSKDSARWWFQLIDNYSCLRFNEMNKEVRDTFDPMEEKYFAMQNYLEKQAFEMYNTDPVAAEYFLTTYCSNSALEVEKTAKDLFFYLIAKYADGGPSTTVSDEWKKLLEKEVVQ
ncbi:MAG: C69 family dipeptidase [Candidatus Atribacteria bacterium]|nr:C69 family dipeptidase [Candidatus Atribacteria bacterium]